MKIYLTQNEIETISNGFIVKDSQRVEKNIVNLYPLKVSLNSYLNNQELRISYNFVMKFDGDYVEVTDLIHDESIEKINKLIKSNYWDYDVIFVLSFKNI